MNITYSESTLMKLKLYNDNKLIYIAYFSGSNYGGTLNLQDAQTAVSPLDKITTDTVVGQWSFISSDVVRGRFSFVVDSTYDYDTYTVMYKDKEIASAKKDTVIKTMKLYFGNIDDFMIVISKKGKIIKIFDITQTEFGTGNVILRAK